MGFENRSRATATPNFKTIKKLNTRNNFKLKKRSFKVIRPFHLRKRRRFLIVGLFFLPTTFYFFCFPILQSQPPAPPPTQATPKPEPQTYPKSTLDFLNPPMLTLEESDWLLEMSKHWGHEDEECASAVLATVSTIIQNQIQRIQTPKNCSSTNNIRCGLNAVCGLGCQIHYRVLCLMMSYVMNLPLLPDDSGWTYKAKWNDVFLPLGANCPPGNNTYQWLWYLPLDSPRPIYNSSTTFYWDIATANKSNLIYPLSEGLFAAPELVQLVEKYHPNPFFWWAGQFLKYIFKLNPNTTRELQMDKEEIGWTTPCIGFQVRRTDKKNEAPDSYHELEEYMREASLFQKNEIIGFPSNGTYSGDDEKSGRPERLYEIVRDVEALSKCDYVICGLSSNVCGLVLGLLSDRWVNSESRLKSLDGYFSYKVYTGHAGSENVEAFIK